MAKVICLANQKGGVGKTTSSNAIATGLRHKGFRVLCVDFDPQGNLSFSMNADTHNSPTIYDVLKRKVKCREAIQSTGIVDILPSDSLLSSVEVEFTGRGREFILRDCLKSVIPFYEYIIIDSPPELGALTVNAFAAADTVLVPVQSDIYSLQGITRLYETIGRIKTALNPHLSIEGMFLVRFNPREELSRTVYDTAELIAQSLKIPLLNTTIRQSVIISKTQALQQDMIQYSPHNNAVMDYQSLVNELLKRGL